MLTGMQQVEDFENIKRKSYTMSNNGSVGDYCRVYRIGDLRVVSLRITGKTGGTSSNSTLATLVSEDKPLSDEYAALYYTNTIGLFKINASDGTVKNAITVPDGTTFYGTMIYPVDYTNV